MTTRNATKAPPVAPVSLVKAPPVAPVTAPTTFGVEALAEATGASSKDVRRWLRSTARAGGAGDTLPGKGGRYAFTASTVEALARAYSTSKARKGTTAAGDAIAALLER